MAGLLAYLAWFVPQKVLFSDYSCTPQEHTEKELKRYRDRGCLAASEECSDGEHCAAPVEEGPVRESCSQKKRRVSLKVLSSILVEQIINAFIVGGVAFFSTLAASQGETVSLKAAGIAFGMTFFFELRKYRKL
ncbi:hypothetical protein ACFLXE_00185 [Chloroflexota bacterium]